MVSAILLAAGTSSRMGDKNKLLLPYRDQTIIQFVANQLHGAGFYQMIAVTGFQAEQVRSALHPFPFEFTHNPQYELGMTTSIQRGVNKASGTGYMICLADMVSITSDEYRLIAQVFEQRLLRDTKCICLPAFNGKQGNPVVFSSCFRDDILKHTDNEGCKNLVQANKQHLHLAAMKTPHILQDVDYPADYKAISVASD